MIKRTNKLMIATLLGFGSSVSVAQPPEMTVYHSPTCQCCGKWIEHAKQNGFTIKDVVTDDVASFKAKLGVPPSMESCHTVSVGGYVVEGHVPAEDVHKLLKSKAKIVGIAAPGMPMGSPGMEMGGRKDHYQVMSFDKANEIKVFAEH